LAQATTGEPEGGKNRPRWGGRPVIYLAPLRDEPPVDRRRGVLGHALTGLGLVDRLDALRPRSSASGARSPGFMSAISSAE
jgi:hypothetical protein